MSFETVLELSFIAIALVGYYVTTVHYKWWKLYNPSPLIRHLLISSLAIDVASTIMAVLAATLLLDIELPRIVRLSMITTSLFIGLGVKGYRRWDLRALDHPDEDITQRVETQDQREDRQFGEERRKLEADHILLNGNGLGTYEDGMAAGREEELKDQVEDRAFGARRRSLEDKHHDAD